MADNIEELHEGLISLIDSIKESARTGDISNDVLQKLNSSFKELDKETDKAASKMTRVGTASGKVVGGMGQFTSSVAKGATSIDAMQGIVNTAKDAITSLTAGIPILGSVIKGVSAGLTAATNYAIDRLQVSYTSFEELSRAGLIGAEGIHGMRAQMDHAGVPLERFVKMLGKNSTSLAYLSGSALKGANVFTDAMNRVQAGEGRHLRHLGFSLEGISDTIVDFQVMNRRLGFSQALTTDRLVKSSMRYGEELDLIAKLTGKQVKDIQADRDVLMSDPKFRAYIDGLGVDPETRNALQDMVGMMPKELQAGFKDLISSQGAATTAEAKKVVIQPGMLQAVMSAVDSILTQGQKGLPDAINTLIDGAKQGKETFRAVTAMVESGAGPGMHYAGLSDLGAMQPLQSYESVKKEQDSQKDDTDKETKTVVEAMRVLENTQKNLDMMMSSTDAATFAIENFSTAIKAVTETLEAFINDGPDPTVRKQREQHRATRDNVAEFEEKHGIGQIERLSGSLKDEKLQADYDALKAARKQASTALLATLNGAKKSDPADIKLRDQLRAATNALDNFKEKNDIGWTGLWSKDEKLQADYDALIKAKEQATAAIAKKWRDDRKKRSATELQTAKSAVAPTENAVEQTAEIPVTIKTAAPIELPTAELPVTIKTAAPIELPTATQSVALKAENAIELPTATQSVALKAENAIELPTADQLAELATPPSTPLSVFDVSRLISEQLNESRANRENEQFLQRQPVPAATPADSVIAKKLDNLTSEASETNRLLRQLNSNAVR